MCGEIRAYFDAITEPHNTWASAFAGTITKNGRTRDILAELLGAHSDSEATQKEGDFSQLSLEDELKKFYVPNLPEKHLNGARLAASIGLGQLAEEELRRCRHVSRNENTAASIDPDIYFVRGMKREALAIRMALDKAGIPAGAITWARLSRHQGKQLSAIWRFTRLSFFSSGRAVRFHASEVIEVFACAIDVIENLQRISAFRSRLGRKFCAFLLMPLQRRALASSTTFSISLQGKTQTQLVRCLALLENDDEDSSLLGELWQLVHDQYSRPNIYTQDGPLISGYHLIEQSTAREEDRLADLVEINRKREFLRT